jgi:hypothetical protein
MSTSYYLVKKGLRLIQNLGIEQAFIQNSGGNSKCVLLLPITRSDELSRKKWQETLLILRTNEPIIIVIIDKTPNSEVKDYCLKRYPDYSEKLYVLCRPRSESVFESQKHVTLDMNLWITQIHDDDDWTGLPAIPKDAGKFDIYIYNVNKLKRIELEEQIVSGTLSTQEIIFGAVPSEIWNGFVSFLSAQGDPLADSLDSSLYLICDVFGKIQVGQGFSYTWNSDNWTNRAKAIRNLYSSTLKMGWGEYSGVNAALVHRVLDQISALSYCATIFKKTLSKEQILHTTSRFNLLDPLGQSSMVRCGRIRAALTATRDFTNPTLRLIEISKYVTKGPAKMKKSNPIALFLIGVGFSNSQNPLFSEFMRYFGEMPEAIFKRKFIFWGKEMTKIFPEINVK